MAKGKKAAAPKAAAPKTSPAPKAAAPKTSPAPKSKPLPTGEVSNVPAHAYRADMGEGLPPQAPHGPK